MNGLPSRLCRNSVIARQAAVVMASMALVGIGLAICIAGASAPAPGELAISIRNGQFIFAQPGNTDPQSAWVAADVPVNVSVRSLDYVYTVQHKPSNRSVVVLPDSEAHVQITFARGESTLEIVQGCGRLFNEHRPLLVVRAD